MDHATWPTLASAANGGGGTPEDQDLTDKIVGDFHILRLLGQGGMGQVYIARQISLNRKVAFKILKAELAANPISLKRFQAEAEAAARVTHANIVQVYAIGAQDGLHFMALEYVEGCNLQQYLHRKGPPEVPLALSIMRQVASALQRASEMGIIHRDIKPENILLTRKGEVKVADFGLSRCFTGDGPALNLTQSGTTVGTPLYMSPEQVQGHPVDPRSDIYSFGVTCYAMLAGTPPFQGQTAFEVALQHVQAEPERLGQVRPDLPRGLCAVVDRMMAKKPTERYQTAREILQELGRLREALTAPKMPSISLTHITDAPAVRAATAVVPQARRRWLAWVVAATILASIGGGALLGWQRQPTPSLILPAQAASVEPASSEVSPQKERERFLLEQVQKTANPGGTRDRLINGIDPRLELSLLYLDQWRLAEADRFFEELVSEPNGVKAYRVLGRVGRAIVLSFEDRAVESNRMFMEVFGDHKLPQKADQRERGFRAFVVDRNPELHVKIIEALDRNAVNGQALPADLQQVHKPQPLPRPTGTRAGGSGKTAK